MGFAQFMNDSAFRTQASSLGFRINDKRGTVGLKLGTRGPLQGANAEIVSESTDRRVSAGRVALGTVLAPGVGTIVGALAKKNSSKIRVQITDGAGATHTSHVDAKEYNRAERFCNLFNQKYSQKAA